MCLCAFLALFTSCEKSEPVEDRSTFDLLPPINEQIQGETKEGVVQIENFTVRQGQSGPIEDIKRLAPNFYASLQLNENKREVIVQRRVALTFTNQCSSGCTSLGRELKGYKSGAGYIQCASASSAYPFDPMHYVLDPKGLYNNSGGNHRYQHHNFNDQGEIQAQYYIFTTGNYYVPDLDIWSDAGRRVTWFDAKNETWNPDPVPTTDETAITYLFQTCCL